MATITEEPLNLTEQDVDTPAMDGKTIAILAGGLTGAVLLLAGITAAVLAPQAIAHQEALTAANKLSAACGFTESDGFTFIDADGSVKLGQSFAVTFKGDKQSSVTAHREPGNKIGFYELGATSPTCVTADPGK
jgi:hypothetical protein